MKWFRHDKDKKRETHRQPVQNYLALYGSLTIGLMATGYLISPYGKVRDVYIEGESAVPDQLVLDASQITRRQTVIGTVLSEAAIAADIIAALPQVKDIQVNWQGLNDISIAVEDYETIAYLSHVNKYQSVLENGVILNDAHDLPIGNNPLLANFEQGPILNEFITAFQEVSEDVQNSISEIHYAGTKTNPYKISLYMNDGNQVLANINDFSRKIGYYPNIVKTLDGKKGVLDMEVGVFFKPFESKTTGENDPETDSGE